MTKTEPAAKPGRPKKGAEKGANSTLTKGSTQASYLAARIKRDRPDIAAAVERGEFPSMRSAAIAAGIVRVENPVVGIPTSAPVTAIS